MSPIRLYLLFQCPKKWSFMAFIYFFHFVLSECWQTWLRVRHNGRGARRIPPESARPDTSIIFENPARSCQPEILKDIFSPSVFPFCFIGMVGGLICDECVCIECVIRQMFSFPDHSGCMGSMALMFHSQWYLSLTSSQMPFHPRKWNASASIFISTFFSGGRSYKLVT